MYEKLELVGRGADEGLLFGRETEEWMKPFVCC